jgi:hypothetical protein
MTKTGSKYTFMPNGWASYYVCSMRADPLACSLHHAAPNILLTGCGSRRQVAKQPWDAGEFCCLCLHSAVVVSPMQPHYVGQRQVLASHVMRICHTEPGEARPTLCHANADSKHVWGHWLPGGASIIHGAGLSRLNRNLVRCCAPTSCVHKFIEFGKEGHRGRQKIP